MRNGLVPALRAIHPAAEANVLRTLALLRDEAEVLDALVDARSEADDALDAARRAAARAGAARVQRLADAGRTRRSARARADEVLALRRTGRATLDLGGGLRAVAETGVCASSAARRRRAARGRAAVPGRVAFADGS